MRHDCAAAMPIWPIHDAAMRRCRAGSGNCRAGSSSCCRRSSSQRWRPMHFIKWRGSRCCSARRSSAGVHEVARCPDDACQCGTAAAACQRDLEPPTVRDCWQSGGLRRGGAPARGHGDVQGPRLLSSARSRPGLRGDRTPARLVTRWAYPLRAVARLRQARTRMDWFDQARSPLLQSKYSQESVCVNQTDRPHATEGANSHARSGPVLRHPETPSGEPSRHRDAPKEQNPRRHPFARLNLSGTKDRGSGNHATPRPSSARLVHLCVAAPI